MKAVKSLQSFKSNKSPGNDSLTAEFHKAFSNVVGNLMVQSLTCAYNHSELSNSQKQAIITLPEKKGKDRRNISNRRPISLIRAVSNRLERKGGLEMSFG